MKSDNAIKDYVKLRGHLKIEVIKDDKVIDVWENHNLITNTARNTFAKLLAGVQTQNTVNRFVMGTMGHVGTDILTPKDSTNGFDSSRTDLFCGTKNTAEKNVKWNDIRFTPSGNINFSSASNIDDGFSNLSTVDVKVQGLEISEPSVTYVINLSQAWGNGLNDNGMVYTECGLYADNELIAMRTFKGKLKSPEVSLRITWNIIF